MELELKRLNLTEAKMDAEAGTIEGYAARYGNRDLGGDVIKGGSARNLDRFVANGTVTIGHDYYKQGVATVKSATEDENGLYVVAEWHSDQDSQKARTIVKERLERGKSVGLSIGFRLLKASQGEQDGKGVRYIEEYEPVEFALTDFPMNPLAGAVMAKSDLPLADHLDQTLAAVEAVTTRCEEVKQLREAEGRDLGQQAKEMATELLANVVDLGERLHELTAKAEPEPDEPETGEAGEKDVDVDLEFAEIEAELLALQLGRTMNKND